MREIVWIASFPKSGNTWVRLFLDAYFMGEVDINDIVASIADDNSIRHALGAGLDNHYDIRTLPVDVQWLARPMALLRLVCAYRINKMDTGVNIPLFVKTHNAHTISNGIEALPEMLTRSTICIVRDPRDVLPSYAKHMGMDMDSALDLMLNKHHVLKAGKEAAKVSDFVSSWPMNVRSYLDADSHDVKVFKYEDMRENPEENFARILRHAGVEPDPQRIKRALEICDLEKLREQEKEKGFRESSPHAENEFFGEGKMGGWKGKLTPNQQRKLEKACGPIMKRLGYVEKVRRIA